MNYTRIEAYMKKHDFLKADQYKIKEYIEQYNRTTTERFNFVDGYLTRKELILIERNGTEHRISRLLLGIQENFI